MALKLVNQTPADLVLAVMSHTLPANLQIIEQAQMTRGAWRVDFRIIGESHAISVYYDDVPVMHEVLACVDVEAHSCAHLHPFSTLQAHQYADSGGYQVQVDFNEMPAWALPAESVSMIRVDFPKVFGIAPVTQIQWKATATGVRWWTLHTYPLSQNGAHPRIIHVHSYTFMDFNRQMNCAERKIAYNQT